MYQTKLVSAMILFVFFSLMTTGCVTNKTFPFRAMSGETIVIPFGRTGDEIGEGVNTNNVTVTIVDGAGVERQITSASSGDQGKLRAVFRAFPDPLSKASLPSSNYADVGDGQLAAIVDLPKNLAPGVGSVKVASSSLGLYYDMVSNVFDYYKERLEVLPGAGSAHTFQEAVTGWGLMGSLTLLPRVKCSVSTASSNIGGVEISLKTDPAKVGPIAKVAMRYNYPNTQLAWKSKNERALVTYTTQMTDLSGSGQEAFTSYLVGQSGSIMDLSGISGVDASGNLDPLYFKVYDINGNLIQDATVTLGSFN